MVFRNMVLAGAASAMAMSAVMVSATAAAQDSAPRNFTMQGSWTLDAGQDYCRLAATFAHDGDELAFALERNRAENFARLILVGDGLVTYRGADSLGYSYMPSGQERMAPFLRSETSDGRDYFNLGTIYFGPDPFAGFGDGPPPAQGEDFVVPPYSRADELTFAANVTGIQIDEGLREPVHIVTGNMRGAIQALQACTDDLLRIWDLDYEAHQTMTRRATPTEPAFEWLATGTIGFGDFPLLGGGANPVRVMVSESGEPTACHIHWPSLDERTNESICDQIMENGSFEPALDADGNAIASYWTVDPIFGLLRPFGS